MTNTDAIRMLDSVETPDGLKITVVRDYASFFNRPTVLNKQSNCWFGSAMRQGNRLHFLTTMPIKDYLSITKIDQAPRGSTVKALKDHQNRPNIPTQRSAIKNYLMETAYTGDKWIFPNFMLNFGVGWTEEMPKGELILLITDEETLSWAAIFIPPSGLKIPPSDGAHRSGATEDLIKAGGEGVDMLLSNGVGVTFVFESSADVQHQDFTDLAQAKPVSESVKATWNVRNVVVRAAKALVLGNEFLSKYVDATSPSVNLSSNSVLIWSMSAVRGSLINAYCPRVEDFDKLDKAAKTKLLDATPIDIGRFIDEARHARTNLPAIDGRLGHAGGVPQAIGRLCAHARSRIRHPDAGLPLCDRERHQACRHRRSLCERRLVPVAVRLDAGSSGASHQPVRVPARQRQARLVQDGRH